MMVRGLSLEMPTALVFDSGSVRERKVLRSLVTTALRSTWVASLLKLCVVMLLPPSHTSHERWLFWLSRSQRLEEIG